MVPPPLLIAPIPARGVTPPFHQRRALKLKSPSPPPQAADIRSFEVALREQEGVLAGQLSRISSRSQQAVAGEKAAAVVDVDAHEAPPSYDACAAGEAAVFEDQRHRSS